MFVYSNNRDPPAGRGGACFSANQNRRSTVEAGPASLVAIRRLPSPEQREVSTRLPDWSVATMDAMPCFVLVLLFGTGIQQTTGKSLDDTDLCFVYADCLLSITPSA